MSNNLEESFNVQGGAPANNTNQATASDGSPQPNAGGEPIKRKSSGVIKKKKPSEATTSATPSGTFGAPEASAGNVIADPSMDASMMNQSQLGGGGGSSPSPGKVKHGRRALREGEFSNVPAARKGWDSGNGPDGEGGATTTTTSNDAAGILSSNALQRADMTSAPPATFAGNADAATLQAIEKNTQDAMQAHEALVQEVAQAATEFHSAMPKQSDLERVTAAKFQSLLQAASLEGLDLQCLMATLTGQFDDEDVAWDPDQLLMQLTSEINDRLGGAGEEEELDANVQYGYGYHDGTGVVNTAAAQAQQQKLQQQQQQQQPPQGRDRSGASSGSNQTQQQVNNNNQESNQQQQQQDDGIAPAHGRRRKN